MSSPQPYPPPPGNPPQPPPRKPISTGDVVVTSILSVGLVGLAFVAFVWSLFAVMAVDACGTPGKCTDGLILLAYVVAWGGLGAAVLVALVGVCVAVAKRTTMWVWPTIGVGVLVVAMVGGGAILNAGVGG